MKALICALPLVTLVTLVASAADPGSIYGPDYDPLVLKQEAPRHLEADTLPGHERDAAWPPSPKLHKPEMIPGADLPPHHPVQPNEK